MIYLILLINFSKQMLPITKDRRQLNWLIWFEISGAKLALDHFFNGMTYPSIDKKSIKYFLILLTKTKKKTSKPFGLKKYKVLSRWQIIKLNYWNSKASMSFCLVSSQNPAVEIKSKQSRKWIKMIPLLLNLQTHSMNVKNVTTNI